MNTAESLYKRHRFPPEIIEYAAWLCNRFNPGHRDTEGLLAKRGISTSHEPVRLWRNKPGPKHAE